MYKISIIIPVFNVENTLENAFDSILNQSIGFESLEIIFVDDNSTDNSSRIIRTLYNKYDNVKAIYLNENSGFAGKPRNIGIENSTADYLMFLDPDDIFLENACEILYNNITKNDLEIVSGNYYINRDSKIVKNNWELIKLNDEESQQIERIDENFNFLLTPPSVWSKIFKKEFILKNNLKFLEGVPAQDLVFVSEALLKAKGIKFINSPIVEYIPRQSGESITSKKTKPILAGFIKSYTELYNIAKEYNEDYAWIGPRNLYFWIKQFCLSDLILNDKIDLLYMANPLFKEFIKSDKLKHPQFLDEFIDLISKKDFLNASQLSYKLSFYYDENILTNNIKEKKIFLLFFGFDMEIGGLAKATFNRANLLTQHGYDVSLLNLDKAKNCRYITQYFYEKNYLEKSVDLVNIYEYYSLKNTLNKFFELTPKKGSKYLIKKIEKNDKSEIFNYYSSNLNKYLVKSKHYLNSYLHVKTYAKKRLIREDYYTLDGFKFLTMIYEENNNSIILNDRFLGLEIEFKDIYEFHTYFISEILLNCENKPFLINENSGNIPNFNNVNSFLAYKIANIHTNPYSGDHHYGSQIRGDFSILKNVTNLDYIVVLTEGLKMDLVKEFNLTNIKAIPNIMDLSKYNLENKNIKKDLNKFSIFARLSPEKNISDAIKAFEIVYQERKDAILEIYGRAITNNELKEEKKLKKLVNELDLQNNVIFKGHVENVNENMSKSLATIFTSDFEGLGMVVLESMLNLTPVISYNIHYGPSDFILDGENGYLVEQGNIEKLSERMLELLTNPAKSIDMGKLAQKYVLKQIDNETLFLKWEEIFKTIYINSKKEELKLPNSIDSKILIELNNNERLKINLYKEIHRLHRQNKLLKSQIEGKNKNKLNNIAQKIKFLK